MLQTLPVINIIMLVNSNCNDVIEMQPNWEWLHLKQPIFKLPKHLYKLLHLVSR